MAEYGRPYEYTPQATGNQVPDSASTVRTGGPLSEAEKDEIKRSLRKWANEKKKPWDAELSDIRLLKDGWGGEGTLAPTRDIIDNAREIIMLFDLPDDTTATPEFNGTVLLEWGENTMIEVGKEKLGFYAPPWYGVLMKKENNDGQ